MSLERACIALMLIVAVVMKDEVSKAKLCFADPRPGRHSKVLVWHRQRFKIHGNVMMSLADACTSAAASF